MVLQAPVDLSGNEITSIKDEVQLLRWILIVAGAYIVLFGDPSSSAHLLVRLFVCVYLPSNMVLHFLAPRIRSNEAFLAGVVLFDTACVSLGIVLTRTPTGDFFLLYFLILFIAALAFGLLVRRVRVAERSAAQAKQQNLLQTDAVAMLAHDIKNPLGVIQGLADLLRTVPATSVGERRSLIERIETNAAQATMLAINFVDASRLEIDALRLYPEPTSLKPIVEHAIDSQTAACIPRQITIRSDLAPGLPDLDLDVRALDRVIANLLSNAIKYSPQGGVIQVRTALRGDLAVLSVRDQGPGIPAPEMPNLFQKYGTLAASLRDSTGLGLFIVRTITEKHGGRVSVECPPEGGSLFEVSLPVPARDS